MTDKINKSFFIWCFFAVLTGLLIAWIDSRPNWDDTGISALMLFLAALLFGFLAFQKPWLIALAVGIWIPLISIIVTKNYGGLLALIPGFPGAYLGAYLRKSVIKD
jgi:hypothetical protein